MSHDCFFWCDLNQLSNVQGRYSKSLGEAEFTVGLGIGVTLWAQAHILPLEGPHALAALDALAVEHDIGDDDGLLGVDLLLAGGALLVSQGPFHFLKLQTLLLLLPEMRSK